ncbi:hypothetical protein ACFOYU_04410 [Microvirga sp. GCM10011540]|uniref:hypothetical protein n=1 Tax=Microvirga sp. GCM10011540 TaxID=3317338 RepID=UPI00360FF378
MIGISPFWRQQCFPGTSAALLIANPVAHLTLKQMEDFVLVMVKVKGQWVPLRSTVLKNRDAI